MPWGFLHPGCPSHAALTLAGPAVRGDGEALRAGAVVRAHGVVAGVGTRVWHGTFVFIWNKKCLKPQWGFMRFYKKQRRSPLWFSRLPKPQYRDTLEPALAPQDAGTAAVTSVWDDLCHRISLWQSRWVSGLDLRLSRDMCKYYYTFHTKVFEFRLFYRWYCKWKMVLVVLFSVFLVLNLLDGVVFVSCMISLIDKLSRGNAVSPQKCFRWSFPAWRKALGRPYCGPSIYEEGLQQDGETVPGDSRGQEKV